jgi:signal peptidase I
MDNNQDLHRDENGEDMTAEQENSVRDEGSVADDTVTDENTVEVPNAGETEIEETGVEKIESEEAEVEETEVEVAEVEKAEIEETEVEVAEVEETEVEVAEGEETEGEETEVEETEVKSKFASIVSAIYDYAEIFAISIVAVIFLFSFGIRLCRVDGSSMNQTLKNDEPLIAANFFYTPKQGDIVVFHLVNNSYHEPLVKRVIALEGQTVEIDMTNNQITVDGKVYADEHAYLSGGAYEMRYEFDKQYIFKDGERTVFRATVPEGKIFVLGDNRNGSSDSRSVRVGFVDKRSVLGRAVLRLSPFAILD